MEDSGAPLCFVLAAILLVGCPATPDARDSGLSDSGFGDSGTDSYFGEVPIGYRGFFHRAEDGSDNAVVFQLFDGGAGYLVNAVCDAYGGGALSWEAGDAGSLVIAGAMFIRNPDAGPGLISLGPKFSPAGMVPFVEWFPGAVCPLRCPLSGVSPCTTPWGWPDGGVP